jgi:hypothetical protein
MIHEIKINNNFLFYPAFLQLTFHHFLSNRCASMGLPTTLRELGKVSKTLKNENESEALDLCSCCRALSVGPSNTPLFPELGLNNNSSSRNCSSRSNPIVRPTRHPYFSAGKDSKEGSSGRFELVKATEPRRELILVVESSSKSMTSSLQTSKQKNGLEEETFAQGHEMTLRSRPKFWDLGIRLN